MDEIVEKLKEIGLNEYQSKVYIALLKKFPATGYEISKLANIPQSRAYDTLKALESMHIVIPSNTKPVTYTPIKPKELTKRYKRKIDSTINFLEKKLPNVKEEEYTEPILSISGRTKILDKIIEIIKNAQKTIFISLWAQDFKYLETYLLDAYNRGLDIKIVKYDNFTCNFGKTFQHYFPRYGKRCRHTARQRRHAQRQFVHNSRIHAAWQTCCHLPKHKSRPATDKRFQTFRNRRSVGKSVKASAFSYGNHRTLQPKPRSSPRREQLQAHS